jgi:hypothetical protein
MQLEPSLLDTPVENMESSTDLNACLNAHGLYNSFQFVLRLSPEVHRKIDALHEGIAEGRATDFDYLRAYSTYLHETIHWWQHVGSTTGLLLSLSYPGQAHANYNHLKKILEKIGPKKSILRYVEKFGGTGGIDTPAGIANTVLNNHFDIEFFRILTTTPGMIRQVVEHPLFDCIGHSYRIAYGNIALILASSFDKDLAFIPDPRNWSKVFGELRAQKVKGFYYRSDVDVVPIGAHHLFEGQARFAQLHFLYFASGRKLTWEDVRAMGMLDGIYGEAFAHFLRLAELEWPPTIDDPVVGLFLLVCDIAINPSDGFPLPLSTPATFITDVDPGFRFSFLCRTVATQRPDTARIITNYSRSEYAEVSEALCRPILITPPLAIADTVCGWARKFDDLKALMEEHSAFGYGPGNLPVRMLFAHFLAFCKDKLERPEFFCWPGAWKTGSRASSELLELFERQSAPFLDKPDDSGIYPRQMSGKNESVVQASFDAFYAANVTYDLTRQWVAMPGHFKYEYGWLTSQGSPAMMKNFADRHFKQIYGADPDSFDILQ